MRESILLPSCSCPAVAAAGGGATSSASRASHQAAAARVAHVLSSSVVAAEEHAVPASDYPDVEELSMRRETAALGRLQDMRDVMFAIGAVCSRLCLLGEDDAGGGGRHNISYHMPYGC